MSDPQSPPLITTPAQLDELCASIRSAGRFAFDTEFVSEQTYEPVLCLLQIATTDRVAIVDPLALKRLDPFWEVLLDPSIEVVMHAAGEDLRIARQQTGRVPARVFDVQLAAGLLGYGYPLSHSNLVNQVLGVVVSGGETRTDWRRRPLSPGQLRYAADDVRYLLPIADAFRKRLADLGRSEWVEAELAEFLEEIRSRRDEDRWRRLPGLSQLSRRGLEVARRLSGWRAEDAKEQNRPLRYLLRDDLLVGIAKRQPTSRRELEALRDFNRHQLLSRSGEILDVIAEAQRVSADQLPDHADRPEDGPGATMVASLLSAALHQCCTQEQMAVSLVSTTNDLKELIRWYIQGRDPGRLPTLLTGWRRGVCGETLLDVLSGRRAVRVVDPTAEIPVALLPLESGTESLEDAG
ncbi:MAG: HRDC domain-containing protein [Isosphaeraceae bacterium]